MTTRSQYRGGVLTFYEDSAFETTRPMSPVFFHDDFLGADGLAAIPANGSEAAGVHWAKKIVGAAPPTVAFVGNAIGGQVACTLTSASQKQDAVLYWSDQLAIDVTKGAHFEARFKLSTLPSAAGVQAVVGLAAPWIDGPDNNTCYLQIGATANGALLIRSYDGVTQISAAAGLTLANTDWCIARISCSDITNVSMWLNGAKATTEGQINFAATGSLAVLQPYLAVYKPSGTGVATLVVDYVKTWMNRA